MKYLTDSVKDTLSIALTVTIAFIFYSLYPQLNAWLIIATFLSALSSRLNTTRYGLSLSFLILILSIISFIITKNISLNMLFLFFILVLIGTNIYLWNVTFISRSILFYSVFPIVLFFIMFFDFIDNWDMSSIISNILCGGIWGIIGSLFILPVNVEKRFRNSVHGIIQSFQVEIERLSQYFYKKISDRDEYHGKSIIYVVNNDLNCKLDWIYDLGFNRAFRESFRFFAIKLEAIQEMVVSLHSLLRKKSPLLDEFKEEILKSLQVDNEIFTRLNEFFENKKITEMPSFINDIEELDRKYNAYQFNLNTITNQQLVLSAVIMNLKEMRNNLLSLLSSVSNITEDTSKNEHRK